MRPITISVVFATSMLLAACSIDSLVSPYRIDVRQGNYVDQQMVSQLRKGMTRDQVRFVLGSPLVVDMFRDNRWDYVYRFTEGWGEPQTRTLSLFFVDDRLDSVEGDVVAAGEGPEDSAAPPARSRVIEVPAVAGRR